MLAMDGRKRQERLWSLRGTSSQTWRPNCDGAQDCVATALSKFDFARSALLPYLRQSNLCKSATYFSRFSRRQSARCCQKGTIEAIKQKKKGREGTVDQLIDETTEKRF